MDFPFLLQIWDIWISKYKLYKLLFYNSKVAKVPRYTSIWHEVYFYILGQILSQDSNSQREILAFLKQS